MKLIPAAGISFACYEGLVRGLFADDVPSPPPSFSPSTSAPPSFSPVSSSSAPAVSTSSTDGNLGWAARGPGGRRAGASAASAAAAAALDAFGLGKRQPQEREQRLLHSEGTSLPAASPSPSGLQTGPIAADADAAAAPASASAADPPLTRPRARASRGPSSPPLFRADTCPSPRKVRQKDDDDIDLHVGGREA